MSSRAPYPKPTGRELATVLPLLPDTLKEQEVTALFATQSLERRMMINVWRRNLLKCVNGHTFHEFDNIGRLRCWQHEGIYDEGSWTCCGRRHKSDPGCQPADHRVSERPYDQSNELVLSKDLYMTIRKVHTDMPNPNSDQTAQVFDDKHDVRVRRFSVANL